MMYFKKAFVIFLLFYLLFMCIGYKEEIDTISQKLNSERLTAIERYLCHCDANSDCIKYIWICFLYVEK